MPLEPPTATEPVGGDLSVVERIALRLLRVKIYGTGPDSRYPIRARRQWDNQLTEDEREEWRSLARDLLADIALGDEDEMPAVPEYKVSHWEGGDHTEFNDVGEAVDFADRYWPGAGVYRCDRVAVRTEWTEVTK